MEDLDSLVTRRVLSPVQAAVFVADAYPVRPDALVLASTYASVGGAQRCCGLGCGASATTRVAGVPSARDGAAERVLHLA